MKTAKKALSLVLAIAMTVLLIPASVISALAVSNYDYSYVDIADRLINPKYLSETSTGEKSLLFSSYNRNAVYNAETGKYENWNNNGDGSDQKIPTIDDDGDGKATEYVLMEAEGAGYISRMWSASAGTGKLRIYIDGELVFDMPHLDYFNNVGFPYDKLSYGDAWAEAARGYNCYVPITFNESCKVVAYSDAWSGQHYYQINATLMPEGVSVEPTGSVFTAEQAAKLQQINNYYKTGMGTNPSGAADAAFESFTVTPDAPAVKTLTGKGAINSLLVKLKGYENIPGDNELMIELLKTLEINVYYDGSDTPAVKAPLGDFFGSAYGLTPIQTMMMGVRNDRTLYNYYYMPYLQGAKVEIVNLGTSAVDIELSVGTEALDIDESKMMYFYSTFTNGEYVDDPAKDPEHMFLNVQGEGRFVGLSLHLYKLEDFAMDSSNSGYNWWGEGDEKFYIDGEMHPSWFGTGTEDFFGYAWCREQMFNQALHSQSYGLGGNHGRGNHVLSRSLMADSIPFASSFVGTLEKYYKDTRYGYTSYYYLTKNTDNAEPEAEYSKEIDLYLIAGQSNAAGTSTMTDKDALYAIAPELRNGYSNILYAGMAGRNASRDFTWVPTKLGLGSNNQKMGPEVGMAINLSQKYNAETGKVAGILKFAHGGTTLSGNDISAVGNWVSPSYAAARGWTMGYKETGALYTEFLRIFEEKVQVLVEQGYDKINIKGMFWMQGENDRTDTAEYYDALRFFISDMRSDLSEIVLDLNPAADDGGAADMAFYIGAISDTFSITSANGIDINKAFVEIQKKVACQTPNCYFIDSSDYEICKCNPDGSIEIVGSDQYHWNQADMLAIGKAVGKDMMHYGAGDYLSYFKFDPSAKTSPYIEGEDLTGVTVSAGNFTVQNSTTSGYNWSGNKMLFYNCKAVDGSINMSIPAPSEGKYVLVASFVSGSDFGTCSASVNGKQIATGIDLYSPAIKSEELTVIGTADLTRGYGNTLTFTATGKNASSTGYVMGIDFLLVIPADEFTSTKDIDLSEYCKITRTNAAANRFYEGESLIPSSITGLSKQSVGACSNGYQMFWRNAAVNNSLGVKIGAPAAGKYVIYASYMRAADFGIVETSVNGEKIGTPTDLFFTNSSSVPTAVDRLTMLGAVDLKEGYDNTLTFSFTGKNESSKGYYMGVDYIIVVPVGEDLNISQYEGALRELTDNERTYEAEDLGTLSWNTTAPTMQANSAFSGGSALQYAASATGHHFSFYIPAGKTAQYAIYANFAKNASSGSFDIALNSSVFKKDADLYAATATVERQMLGIVELTAGYGNLVTFTVSGKNTASSGFNLGIDTFTIVPLDSVHKHADANSDNICDDCGTVIGSDSIVEKDPTKGDTLIYEHNFDTPWDKTNAAYQYVAPGKNLLMTADQAKAAYILNYATENNATYYYSYQRVWEQDIKFTAKIDGADLSVGMYMSFPAWLNAAQTELDPVSLLRYAVIKIDVEGNIYGPKDMQTDKGGGIGDINDWVGKIPATIDLTKEHEYTFRWTRTSRYSGTFQITLFVDGELIPTAYETYEASRYNGGTVQGSTVISYMRSQNGGDGKRIEFRLDGTGTVTIDNFSITARNRYTAPGANIMTETGSAEQVLFTDDFDSYTDNFGTAWAFTPYPGATAELGETGGFVRMPTQSSGAKYNIEGVFSPMVPVDVTSYLSFDAAVQNGALEFRWDGLRGDSNGALGVAVRQLWLSLRSASTGTDGKSYPAGLYRSNAALSQATPYLVFPESIDVSDWHTYTFVLEHPTNVTKVYIDGQYIGDADLQFYSYGSTTIVDGVTYWKYNNSDEYRSNVQFYTAQNGYNSFGLTGYTDVDNVVVSYDTWREGDKLAADLRADGFTLTLPIVSYFNINHGTVTKNDLFADQNALKNALVIDNKAKFDIYLNGTLVAEDISGESYTYKGAISCNGEPATIKVVAANTKYESQGLTITGMAAHTVVSDDPVAPTCTTPGTTGGKHCSACGEVLEVPTVVPAKGHTEQTVKGYDATCTATGLTDGVKCSVCQTWITEQQTIPVKDHIEVAIQTPIAPTCTTPGATAGVKCSVCDKVITPVEEIKALGHTAVTDKAVDPTCTTTGLTEGEHCDVCNAVLIAQKIIDALGHTETIIQEPTAPDCTNPGYTSGKKCSVCGEVLEAITEIPALGHTKATREENRTEATCTAEGSYDVVTYCSVCNTVINTEHKTIEKLEHTVADVKIENEVKATCAAEGSYEKVAYCACGHEIERVKFTEDKLPHTETTRTEDISNSTCIVAGKYNVVTYCSVCQEVLKTESFDKELAEHTPKAPAKENVNEASCTLPGSYEMNTYCSVCGELLKTETVVVEATGHQYNEGETNCYICGEGERFVAPSATVENGSVVVKNPSNADIEKVIVFYTGEGASSVKWADRVAAGKLYPAVNGAAGYQVYTDLDALPELTVGGEYVLYVYYNHEGAYKNTNVEVQVEGESYKDPAELSIGINASNKVTIEVPAERGTFEKVIVFYVGENCEGIKWADYVAAGKQYTAVNGKNGYQVYTDAAALPELTVNGEYVLYLYYTNVEGAYKNMTTVVTVEGAADYEEPVEDPKPAIKVDETGKVVVENVAAENFSKVVYAYVGNEDAGLTWASMVAAGKANAEINGTSGYKVCKKADKLPTLTEAGQYVLYLYYFENGVQVNVRTVVTVG